MGGWGATKPGVRCIARASIDGGTASPTVTVSGVPNPATTGPVSYSVLVTGAGATPTGSVSVSGGQGGSCIIASLGSGSGSCSITENASESPYTVTGTYSGDANYSSGNSTPPRLSTQRRAP